MMNEVQEEADEEMEESKRPEKKKGFFGKLGDKISTKLY